MNLDRKLQRHTVELHHLVTQAPKLLSLCSVAHDDVRIIPQRCRGALFEKKKKKTIPHHTVKNSSVTAVTNCMTVNKPARSGGKAS